MATTYAFKATNARGELQEGVLTGDSPDVVAERVRRMGLRPVTIEVQRHQWMRREIRIGGRSRTKRGDAVAVFSRQFSTMIGAGVPMIRCLNTLAKQAEDPSLATAIDQIRIDVGNGDPLSVAVGRQSAWFDEFYVAMLRAGESSGGLADVLERLAAAAEGASRLRRKIRSALSYPVVVAVIIALAVVGILTFLIPAFSDIFAGLKGDLPLPTKVVVAASDALVNWFPLVVLAVAGAIWGFKRWKRTPEGRLRWDRTRLRFPVFGRLAQLGALARFSRNLAVLVDAGVPFVEALPIASSTAGNRVLELAAGRIAAGVRNGGSISAGMEEEPIFTDVVVQMVAAGEESGAVDIMLVKIADMYELEVETTVDGLTSLLEPLLIAVMAVTVGGILLAVYLPMFKAVSLVK